MSKPKRHHFVPQFYLRRFSAAERHIRCLHKDSGLLVPCASIKGQCAINNFYGWQENIESSLGVIEASASNLFRKIDHEVSLPNKYTMEWEEILIFIALQSSRTQLSGRQSDELADYYYKIMLEDDAQKAGIDLSEFRIGSSFPAALPMRLALQACPELNKLDKCLLINNSRIPFITSDNPVVYYNSSFSEVDDMGVIGLSSQGLQIFYPISPKLTIALYDPESYNNPSNTGNKILRESDVIQINILHYLWSERVVFWGNEETDPCILEIAKHCDAYTSFERIITRESDRVDNENGKTGSLLHSYRAHAPIEANFRFMNISSHFVATGNLIRGSSVDKNQTGGRSYIFKMPSETRSKLRKGQLARAVRNVSQLLS